MRHSLEAWRFLVVLLALLVMLTTPHSHAVRTDEERIKTTVFRSPKFVLEPGSVVNKYYYNIDFPNGHIAIKDFNAEVVDETGHPVPLHETYLHHWVVGKYFHHKNNTANHIFVRNSGICQNNVLGQYYGLGSETRKTDTHVPDPFGVEIGNPAELPDGYEERWMLNVHAIDTRGAEDRLGCTECRCDLYNVTKDEYGRPLRDNYKGGLYCCYDQTRCRVRVGFGEGKRRSLYLRYTVKWVDWDEFIVPVKIYIFDVTDSLKKLNDSTEANFEHQCRVEYEVESCSNTLMSSNNKCNDAKRASMSFPTGGYVIYGVAHQHTGGSGAALYGEDGRVICTSLPIYGQGKEAGNEEGYIVGMSSCYPQPGTVSILDGETLTLESNYSSIRSHTGVMGLFYILVAERLPNLLLPLDLPHSGWE